MELIQAQYEWDVLLSKMEDIQDFLKLDIFEKIKDKPTCALMLVENYHQGNFEEIFFSFDKSAISSPLLALKYIENSRFDIKNPKSIDYISQFLNDPVFVNEAIKKNPGLYNILSLELKSDFFLATQALKKDGMFYSYLPESLKKLNKFKLLATRNEKSSGYAALSDEDKNHQKYIELAYKDIKNYKFLPEAVKIKYKSQIVKNPFLLEFAPSKLLDNDAFVRKVMLEKSWSLQWAPEKFKKDRHWCAALYQKDASCLPFISKELLTEDFCLEILSSTHHQSHEVTSYWNNLPLNLQNDDFLKKAILYSDLLIAFASDELLKNNFFLVEIQKIHPNLYENISANIKKDNLVLMKDLCQVIVSNIEDTTNKKIFSFLRTNAFIKSFPMEKYLDIKKYLTKRRDISFNDLLDDLSKYSLDQKLGQSLLEKDDISSKKVKL